MSIEYTSGEKTFRSRKLNPEQALGCVKRLGFMLEGLRDAMPAMRGLKAQSDKSAKLQALLTGVGPVARAFAAMPDADTKYIVDACMGVTEYHQDGQRWAQLVSPARMPMFASEIELFDQFVIVRQVLQESLARFFGALLSALSEGAVEE